MITDLSLTLLLQNCSAKHSAEVRKEGLTDFCISGNFSRRRRMRRSCRRGGRGGISGKVTWMPSVKTVVFLPNAAQSDKPSIPPQNNCSLGLGSPPRSSSWALHYHSHPLRLHINKYDCLRTSERRRVTSGSRHHLHVKCSVF